MREVIAYRAGLNVAALGESHLHRGMQLTQVLCKLTSGVTALQPCWSRPAYASHLQTLSQTSGRMQWLQLVLLAWVLHCTWCICMSPQSSASCRWEPGDPILQHALTLQPLHLIRIQCMQGLYGVGTVGALGLALSQVTLPCIADNVTAFCLSQPAEMAMYTSQNGQAVPRYVAEHPSAVWLVGPFFAAVTGLAFKEVSLNPTIYIFRLLYAYCCVTALPAVSVYSAHTVWILRALAYHAHCQS